MFNKLLKFLTGNRAGVVAEESAVVPDEIEDLYETKTSSTRTPTVISEPVITGNLDSNRAILIVDDQESVFYLYETDFETILERYGYDICANYKIVKCSGYTAGATAEAYVNGVSDDIVIGILDLTLGTPIVTADGGIRLYDGVDIALEIIKGHPRCKISFCTAHIMDSENPAIKPLVDKFLNNTGHNLLDYSFSKNSDRAEFLYELVTAVDKGDYTDYRIIYDKDS